MKRKIFFWIAFLSLIFIAPNVESRAGSQASWSVFWQKFKTSVVSGDKKTVTELTAFPYQTMEGNLDAAAFQKSEYNALFGSRKIKQCFAKAKPVKDGTSYSVFCGEVGYFFDKVGGSYKFKETFAND